MHEQNESIDKETESIKEPNRNSEAEEFNNQKIH